jgi:hypothetical protein
MIRSRHVQVSVSLAFTLLTTAQLAAAQGTKPACVADSLMYDLGFKLFVQKGARDATVCCQA